MTPKEYLKKISIEPVEIFNEKVFSYSTCLNLMRMYHREMLKNVDKL